jgi:hypothetical protein
MGIQHAQQSAYVKEMQKWESRPVMIGDTMIMPLPASQGGRADLPHQQYPRMLYRAVRANGGPQIAGHITVESEREQAYQESHGWHDGQEKAIKAIHDEDLEFARLAANRAHQEKNMSPNAKAEAAAIDESTIQHQPVIPEQSRPKVGRGTRDEGQTS